MVYLTQKLATTIISIRLNYLNNRGLYPNLKQLLKLLHVEQFLGGNRNEGRKFQVLF